MNTEDLILNNINLIHYVIKKMNLYSKSKYDYQEYYDAGLEGLIRGANTYDSSKGITQSTYLSKCIRHQIAKSLYLKTMPKRFNQYGKDISLDNFIFSDKTGDEFCLEDFIPDPNINIEQEIEKKALYTVIQDAIENIKFEKDKIFLKYRFGLIDGKYYTYRELSEIFGVSRGMAYKRVNRALNHLKVELKKWNN